MPPIQVKQGWTGFEQRTTGILQSYVAGLGTVAAERHQALCGPSPILGVGPCSCWARLPLAAWRRTRPRLCRCWLHPLLHPLRLRGRRRRRLLLLLGLRLHRLRLWRQRLGLRRFLPGVAGQRPPHTPDIELALCLLPRLPVAGLGSAGTLLAPPPADARAPILLRAQQLVGQLSKAGDLALQAATGEGAQQVGTAAARWLIQRPARLLLLLLLLPRCGCGGGIANPAPGLAGALVDAPLQLGLHRVSKGGTSGFLQHHM